MLDVKNVNGFCADPYAPTWLNVKNYYWQMSRTEYEGRLANATCHNLCKKLDSQLELDPSWARG